MSYTLYDQKDLTEDNLIANPTFIEEASTFLEDREGYRFDFSDPNHKKEIYDAFMEHFRVQNVNEVTATRDLFYAQTADDNKKQIMNNLMDTFDKMDSDLGYEAVGDYMEGIFTSPTTYAGMFSFGAAKAGSLAANQGVKLGIREILKRNAKKKLKEKGIRATQKNIDSVTPSIAGVGVRASAFKEGFKQGGYKTALGAAGIDAVGAGITITQQERTRNELGIKDGVSLADIGLATTFSFLGGGLIGSITGSAKTISSNIAEQIRMIAIKKESGVIEKVHKNITSKVSKSSAISKVSGTSLKDDFKIVKEKLALIETVPEKLAEGKKLKEPVAGLAGDIEFTQVGYVKTLDDKFHDNIASAAAKILSRVAPQVKTVKTKKGTKQAQERITSRLARGLADGDISDGFIAKILDEHGIGINQLTSLMVAEYSEAGKLLGRSGRIARQEKKELLEELTEIDQKLINLADVGTSSIDKYQTGIAKSAADALLENEDSAGSLIRRFFNRYGFGAINKARIGLMTIQTATTARNTTNGYMRNYVYALDNLGAGLYNVTKAGVQSLGGVADSRFLKEAKRSVMLGGAQMRTGIQSALMKDMQLGMRSWETEALNLLFRDERFQKSDLARQLFREMGDVGNLTGTEGGIVRIARMANILNTVSDNLFKRAVFSREIDKYMFANGIKGGLKGFFEESYLNPANAKRQIGKFSLIPDEAIGKAMAEALRFTYQEGKFQGKAGTFNKLADGFIALASSILGSTFAPFPRYMVNQLVFQWEHAPILGLVNLGGILNKPGGKKGVRGIGAGDLRIVLDDEAVGKQLGGLGMLAAFYGIRANYGDENTGPYEFKIGGETYDLTAALGPFMGAAFFADWLYRHTGPKQQGTVFGQKLPVLHDNDKVAVGINLKSRDAINAIVGGSAKGGSGLYIVDAIVDEILNDKDASNSTIEEYMYRYAGDLFNTALVGAGMFKDLAGTFLEPEYRVVQDTGSIDLMEYMFKRATRSLPDKFEPERGEVPLYNPARNKPLLNVNPFVKMITGFTQLERRTIVQKEMNRLLFDFREFAPQKVKGDPVLTNLAKGEMGANMDNFILPYIISPDYQNIESDRQKRYQLKRLINDYRALARVKVLEPTIKDTPQERHRKFKSIFLSLPSEQKAIIEEAYKSERGASIHEVNMLDEVKGDYQAGIVKYIEMFGQEDKEFLNLKKIVERGF